MAPSGVEIYTAIVVQKTGKTKEEVFGHGEGGHAGGRSEGSI